MNKFFAAIALTVALPAMAHAQAVTAAPKAGCCAKMKGMAGCKDMAKMPMMDHGAHGAKTVTDPHAGHDMSKPMAKSSAATATPTN